MGRKRMDYFRGNVTREMDRAIDLLIETDQAAVMKDKYPKAQYHFLIVPKKNIANVTALTRCQLPLLEHMKELANKIIERQQLPPNRFKIGFKIDQFMERLNMHVISDDFYSESMRRISHWNSFNTDLFITYNAVYAVLLASGSIEPMPLARAQEYRKAKQLICNQCNFKTEIFVGLKAHLLEHWKKQEVADKIKQQVEKVTRMLDEVKLEDIPIAVCAEASSQVIELSKPPATSSPKEKNISVNFQKNAPTDRQPQAPSSNFFERRYEKGSYNQKGGVKFQPHQGKIKNFPKQQGQPTKAPSESKPFNQKTPLVRPSFNIIRQPNGQHPRRPPIPDEHQDRAQPHFNPFKQASNMVQPCHEVMKNKPHFKHDRKSNQAPNKDKVQAEQHN